MRGMTQLNASSRQTATCYFDALQCPAILRAAAFGFKDTDVFIQLISDQILTYLHSLILNEN